MQQPVTRVELSSDQRAHAHNAGSRRRTGLHPRVVFGLPYRDVAMGNQRKPTALC